MNSAELTQKLENLEWEDFEVKEAQSDLPKSVWETVSAFSNSSGGWIIFGIKQAGASFEIIGLLHPEKIEQDFLNVLRTGQKFNTIINPECALHKIAGKNILAFYIPPSSKKPIYFNSPSNTFIRRASSDQRATKEEIDSMYRDQTFGTKTSETVLKTGIADLKEKSVRTYRAYMAQFNPLVSYNRLELDEFLIKMRVLERESGQCTFAGLLFFGKRDSIERFFPDFRVDLLEIPGTSYEDATSRYSFRMSQDDYDNLWEVYFECFNRLRKEVDVTFKMNHEGFGEDLSPGLLAVREALVNMLMHADYFAPSHSRIRIFTNQIEYYNAGGLPKPLQELKQKDLSIPRNPILAKLFRMVKLAENAGYGFDKIDTNWKIYNQVEPIYIADFDSVIVQLVTNASRSRSGGEKVPDKPSEFKADLQQIREVLSDNYLDNLTLFDKNFTVITSAIAEGLKIPKEHLRETFGETSERFRRDFGDKPAMLLFLITVNGKITAKEAASCLQVSSRTVENYLLKLKAAGVVVRVGSDFGGEWRVTEKILPNT
jgi:ATP-dependent DNA helicase RecG